MNKLFVSFLCYFFGLWTGVWSFVLCWITFQCPFAALGLPWKAITVYLLLTAILFPAERESRAVWTLYSILSSSGLWFHSLLFNIISIFPYASVGYRWGDKVEMSLGVLWFGNSDDCKCHWATGILLDFLCLQILESMLIELKKCFKQVNNSFGNARSDVCKLTLTRVW